MDPDAPLVVMILLICVGLPVILGIGSNMFKTWIKHREAMAGALNAQAAERERNVFLSIIILWRASRFNM